MSEPRPGPDRWARAEALFHDLIGMPPADRLARLDRACAGDAGLRELVERLLAADATDADTFHHVVARAVDHVSRAAGTAHVDRRLGPYRLIEPIGQGGMGTVYVAERVDDEYDHRVAVKVVRGLLDPERVRRFRVERQILASLHHPNIAGLLDGGTTEDGLPYLVMDYIEGTPIDRYVLDRQLPVADRLRLFLTICDAIGHAHRQLVVHRDLKPSNILVTASGAPMLLDFGIAKLLETDDPEMAATTATGVRMLTPDYAAPEQVRGERVTTATDIYSLGVLLFELLTGQRPHRFRTLTAQEIERVVCDTDAPRPRSIEPGLDEDLDLITLTALAKEPERRYGSAEALAGDIRRYLDGLPILARPSTWRYRARRFTRRHRWGVAAAAALALMLIGFSVIVSVQAARLARARDRAQVERDAATQVSEFLVELFEVADPSQARGNSVTARELVDRGAARIEQQLAGQPAVQGHLMDTIGRVYRALGLYDRAGTVLESALTIRDAALGRRSADTARTMEGLAETFRERADYDRAEALHREALDIRREVLGDNHVEVASSLNNLGLTLTSKAGYEEAEPLLRRAVQMWRRALGGQHPQVAVGLNNLAQLLRRRGRYAEAETLLRESLAIRQRAFGEPHPLVSNSLAQLAQVVQEQGRLAEARNPMRRALEMRQAVYETDHPLVATAANNLAALLHDLGDLRGAGTLYRQAVASNRRRLGDAHPEVAVSLNNLASLLEDQGDLDAAVPLFREALSIRQQALGPEHPAVARGLNNLARALVQQGHASEAAPLADRALAMRRALLGERHVEVASSLATVASVRRAIGQPREAETRLRDALELQRALVGGMHPGVATIELRLAEVLLDLGRLTEAEAAARDAVQIREARLPAAHWHLGEARALHGEILAARGQQAEARALLVTGHDGLLNALGAADRRVRHAAAALDKLRSVASTASAQQPNH